MAKKKKFKVCATYMSRCYLEIEAKDADEAYDIAMDTDGGDFIESTNSYYSGDWDIDPNEIEEIK